MTGVWEPSESTIARVWGAAVAAAADREATEEATLRVIASSASGGDADVERCSNALPTLT